MAEIVTEESGVGRSLEGVLSPKQHCQSGEALAEWRSSEQVENGTPSTSPPYWDSDDDDDCGPKPSELYGKYTWKIDKFSQINKRELRSNAFEVGGYKWYILIYPQGCDVCNHLSLFLCVANHDKLLPGWSHFAQFTIAVVNKDPKKSKYSDTLHRFWKKEHDWGWKKFMELSKVLDGFIDADTLIIKAQVQVIRERADRPFRCLDCQYRRELVRVYLTNVEQICRRFVEERRGKLGKLIEDKARWTSFCAFWLGMDQTSRRRMSWEKTDSVLKVVVKHFFIEKEVTSTLVMDSLYSGLKALEGQAMSKKGRGKSLDSEELPVPIVRLEKDTFVLVDDVLLLLERAAMEPLPPKDEKGPQNRTKEGCSGEDLNKDSIERDERRLTELGRRTIEIFFLAHIFSKIEVAYQEAVALKRQEELIREEEAAWMAGSEQKTKRGAADKEKKAKKKQGKQKKNNRRGKDKGRDEKPCLIVQDKPEPESPTDDGKYFSPLDAELVLEKSDTLDDVSDVSDSMDCLPETLQPDSEDRDASSVIWDTDTSEAQPSTEVSSSGFSGLSAVQNGGGKKSHSAVDDSSSTCSTDSVPSGGMNGTFKANPPNHRNQKSSSRAQNQRAEATNETNTWATELRNKPSESVSDAVPANEVPGSCNTAESESQGVILPLLDQGKRLEQCVQKAEQVTVALQRQLSTKDVADVQRSSPDKATEMPSPPRSPPKNSPSAVQMKPEPKSNATSDPVLIKKPSSDNPRQADKIVSVISVETTTSSKSDTLKAATLQLNGKSLPQVEVSVERPAAMHVPVTSEKPNIQKVPGVTDMPTVQHVPVPTEKPLAQQAIVTSRPLSAPLNSAPRRNAPVVSTVQSTPLLSRSMSAAGCLGPDPSSASHSYVPQSYRNAMMGNAVTSNSAGFTHPHSPNSAINQPHTYMQPPTRLSAPMLLQQNSERMEPNSIRPGFSFAVVNHDTLHNDPQWIECLQVDSSRSMHRDPSPLLNEIQNFDLPKPVHNRSQDCFPTEFPACMSGRHSHGVLADDFPHLDIINDLLDDEHAVGKVNMAGPNFHSFNNGTHLLNRQFSFPGDIGMSSDMGPSNSSCRFGRTQSYNDDGFQHNYSNSGNHFESMRDVVPPANAQPYMNEHIDGLIPSQWQMPDSDISFLSMRKTNNGYSYHIPEYSNLACGVNGYTMFRPSNGH